MKYPLISDKIICGITAVKDDITLDIAKMKTYLNSLNLPYGLLAHFGKKRLEIIGICSQFSNAQKEICDFKIRG